LLEYAQRIQLRATNRMGELLKLVEPGVNRFDRREGDLPPNRKAAGDDAGMSEHQRKTALRVASVPEDDFERQRSGCGVASLLLVLLILTPAPLAQRIPSAAFFR